MKYLGIDLGGTNVAAAVVDSEGTILGKVSLPTPRGAEAVADPRWPRPPRGGGGRGTALDEVVSVGIGAPGALEPDTGVIKYWSNLDFTNVPITALMKARLDKEILLENDANAAALGEYAAGAGKGSQSMVAVTGYPAWGAAPILNGKLYTGFNYAGMEIGHFVIEHGRAAVHLRTPGLLRGLLLRHRPHQAHPPGDGGGPHLQAVGAGGEPGGGQRPHSF